MPDNRVDPDLKKLYMATFSPLDRFVEQYEAELLNAKNLSDARTMELAEKMETARREGLESFLEASYEAPHNGSHWRNMYLYCFLYNVCRDAYGYGEKQIALLQKCKSGQLSETDKEQYLDSVRSRFDIISHPIFRSNRDVGFDFNAEKIMMLSERDAEKKFSEECLLGTFTDNKKDQLIDNSQTITSAIPAGENPTLYGTSMNQKPTIGFTLDGSKI